VGRLGRVSLTPGIAPQCPAELGLSELRPALESAATEEGAALPLEYRQQAVAALAPFALVLAQALFRPGAVERADEARHLGVGMQRDELVQVVERHRSQQEALGLDRDSHAVPRAHAP
jgi:hypothetical protein